MVLKNLFTGQQRRNRHTEQTWKLGLGLGLGSEKAMAPHSSILAWRIPETEEPSGLPFKGSHRVGHD